MITSDNQTRVLGTLTDVGKVREINQDCLITNPAVGLFMVADGMGGHLAGEKAAQTAVDVVGEIIGQEGREAIDRGALIQKAIQEANRQIVKASLEDASMRGMGTTATVAMADSTSICVGHVGDSRAYLIRTDAIEQITEDHSVVAQLLKAGAITQQEAANHPYRNVITRCLGMQMDIDADLFTVTWNQGDFLLLCSDGLCGLVTDEEMLRMVNQPQPPQQICQQLFLLAMDRGGYDNITVVLLQNPGA